MPAPHPHPAPPPLPSPLPVVAHIAKSGQDALWAAFVLHVLIALVVAVLAARLAPKHRALHLLALAITGVAALGYYAMATHSGATYVCMGWRTVQGVRTLVFRQVFWARYVSWALTAPLVLLALALLAGLPWMHVAVLLVAGEAAVLTTACAGLAHARDAATWGWFAFSCIFLVLVFAGLLWQGRKCAAPQDAPARRVYTALALYTVLLWTAHAVVFALGDGAGRASANAAALAHAVLDVLAQGAFALALVLAAHRVCGGEDAPHAACFSDAWVAPRGRRGGAIQLPGGED